MDRRTFLRTAGALLLAPWPAWSLEPRGRCLIVVQLGGGNDGINTVIPYRNLLYRKLRPTLALDPATLYPVSGSLALHPGLARLSPLYQQGNVAIVGGLGYPQANRSHFVATDIWHSALVPPRLERGWIGRLSDTNGRGPALAYGPILPPALYAHHTMGGTVEGLDQFHLEGGQQRLRQLYRVRDEGPRETLRQLSEVGLETLDIMARVVKRIDTRVPYPNTGFAQFLRLAAQMLADGMAPAVFHAGIGGFDTHSDQIAQHHRSLSILGDGIAAFFQDLALKGLDQRVVVATYSEFGRRARENASGGTDHGAAAPHLVVGPSVRGGCIGRLSDIDSLENGDVPCSLDFRRYYAALIRWLGVPVEKVLGAPWAPIALL